jgi:tetraacyldisaccharide 4'-kinase
MGGSGKTPFVVWLAARLKAAGRSPAILTRGYRRRAPERQTVVAAGAEVPVDRTGDEAQILVRAGVAPVGIGADRAAAGRAMQERFHPDVFLLDDGFQHWRLARDADLVLVDALDPLGGGAVFPQGRLREPLEQWRRASAFVITRTEPGRSYDGIVERLRRYNPEAPVFRARVRAESWVDAASGAACAAGSWPGGPVAAFCALANPAAFWQTLDQLGLQPLVKRVLGDHPRYRPVELKRLAAEARMAGAQALVTTEKDAMNLCAHVADLIAPLRLFWLKIGIEVEDEARLLELVLRAAPRR